MVLSLPEVSRIIDSIDYLKHKVLLMTIYSAGLRVSEAINLKVSDIDSENMRIFVRSGKGDKDRYTILSHTTLKLLRKYYIAFRPTNWLFPSLSYPKNHLSVRSVQQAFHSSRIKAGIIKPATVHTLRHSFATHLLINGTNLFTIKTLLGHKSIQSTMVYLHLAPTRILSVVSPLDLEVPDFE
ncbi:tyrosine-type recombinase/integrase [Petrocella atlantisensis]